MSMFSPAALQAARVSIEASQRALVVSTALQWVGTPYHHAACVKGAGVDCAMFPFAVYKDAHMIPAFEVPYYPNDWHIHNNDERYLDTVVTWAREVEEPTGPGDFVLMKYGRCYAHGAIITDWPFVVHSMMISGVVRDDATNGRMRNKDKRFFTLWGRE